MTHILHLDASARGVSSHSRTVSGELVEAMKAAIEAARNLVAFSEYLRRS